MDDVFSLAKETALRVGKRVYEELKDGSFDVKHKGRFDLVTEIDLWSEKEIINAVKENFSDHVVVGEESSKELCDKRGESIEEICKDGIVWVVDPIDGTTNFINGIPQVAVSIGVLKDGERKLGVAYDVCRDELFTAQRGKGARLNGEPIQTSKKERLDSSVIATGFPYEREEELEYLTELMKSFLRNFRSMRALGSAVLDQCWLACGRVDVFMEYHLNPWDVAAGSLIVEEAGGEYVNFADGDFDNKFSLYKKSFLSFGKNLKDPLREFVKENEL